LLHGARGGRNAPYPRWISGGAFEIGPAKFGHPVKDPDANPGFCFLIFKRARLELRPDDGLPAVHHGFTPAALTVARCLLPCHPTDTVMLTIVPSQLAHPDEKSPKSAAIEGPSLS
jgi:hypothetical protein